VIILLQHTNSKLDCWKRASFLSERTTYTDNLNYSLGKKRIEKWKEMIEYEDLTLDECLVIEGKSSEELYQMLCSKDIELKYQTNTKWMETMNDIISGKYDEVHIPDIPSVPFYFNFIRPFIQYAYFHLHQKLHYNNDIMDLINVEIETTLLMDLVKKLSTLSARTMVLELNIARVSEQLQGNSSEERLRYFSDVLLRDKEYTTNLFQEYAVLSRLLITRTNFWLRNIIELITRLNCDFKKLQETFAQNSLGKLKNIQIQGVGDSHREGRSVGILTFDSGTKLVYKPRPLEVDLQFNQLIHTINNWGLKYPLRTAVTLNRGSYGWTEFVEGAECTSIDEVKRFYWRMGSYLAILYSLNAVDFHHENIIASGEYPMLIDLETILHNNSRFQSNKTAFENAQDLIRKSVLQVGLLPLKAWGKDGREGIDVSGLGGQEGQVFPNKIPVLEEQTKDTAHIKSKYVALKPKDHRPRFKGTVLNAADYVDDIVLGFTETYNLLKEHKAQFINKLKSFENIKVRQILRPTRRYGALQVISMHPDFLRDGLDREMILNKLWIDSIRFKDLKKVIYAEKRDMLLGDIPYFTSELNKKHLFDSYGNCIPDYFHDTALNNVIEKIEQLNSSDCKQQITYIRSALELLKPPIAKKSKPVKDIKYQKHIDKKEFLNKAIEIGEYLLKTAIIGDNQGEKDLCWIGAGYVDDQEGEWRIEPVGTSLYEGVSGIALFLAYLAEETGRKDFKLASRRAFLPVLEDTKQLYIGPFNGITGYFYVANHLSTLWEDDDLLIRVLEKNLPDLERLIIEDKHLDILGGVAGCSIVLLQLYKKLNEPKLLDLAKKCGERILQTAIKMDQGIGWKVSASTNPLSGFSHGAAGFAWALYELANVTGDTRYSKAGEQALDFERTFFSSEFGNWLDVRYFNGKTNAEHGVIPTAWCHGAPGIVLSRLLITPYTNDPFIQKEIQIGIETTLKHGFGRDHSLCHGDIGNLDILMYAASKLQDKQLNQIVERYSHHI